jgi:hypothetical protein
MDAASTRPGLGEVGHADIVELTVGEVGAEMADRAAAVADEDLQAALRRQRIAGHAGRIVTFKRVAEFVEGRAAA